VESSAFGCSKTGRFVARATHFPQSKPAESLRFCYEIDPNRESGAALI
jgi:hypothetical protein